MKNPRVVVCAAIRNPEGLIIAGARHYDTVMRGVISAAGFKYGNWEQGFIDQAGIFLTREEAFKLATERNQVKYRDGFTNPVLFSEDLY